MFKLINNNITNSYKSNIIIKNKSLHWFCKIDKCNLLFCINSTRQPNKCNFISSSTTKIKYKMEQTSDLLAPPTHVRGITKLDRNLFNKTVKLPKLRIKSTELNNILPCVKKFLLKMEKLKPIQNQNMEHKLILLHPNMVKSFDDISNELSENFKNIEESSVIWDDVDLKYENWKCDEILKSILPEEQDGFSSYSRIGHLLHLNLKDHLLPYKYVIAEVLKDKTIGCKTIINKTNTIDNTYRNFELELLAGEPDYNCVVKENGAVFKFDFSQVYWNPRLATEHEKIIKLLEPGDVLYDVFCGVGPFSVPAGKKKCNVIANDLNPSSYKYLNENCKLNKVDKFVRTANKDGKDFIVTDLRQDLSQRWKTYSNESQTKYAIHVVMNLPAIAVEFLPAFIGLLCNYDGPIVDDLYPIVHVYCFAKGVDDPKLLAKNLVEENLKYFELNEKILLKDGIQFVRNVAPNKNMMRVSFQLNREILFYNKNKRKLSSTELSAGDVDGDGIRLAEKIKCSELENGEKGQERS